MNGRRRQNSLFCRPPGVAKAVTFLWVLQRYVNEKKAFFR